MLLALLQRAFSTQKRSTVRIAVKSIMVSPDRQEVLPLSLEPLVKQDGTNKNDCETYASKRLSTTLRKMHPNFKIVAREDALYGNAPHLNLLKSLGVYYLIKAKPGNHIWLFSWVNASSYAGFTLQDKHNEYEFLFISQVPLSKSNEALKVNFLQCS